MGIQVDNLLEGGLQVLLELVLNLLRLHDPLLTKKAAWNYNCCHFVGFYATTEQDLYNFSWGLKSKVHSSHRLTSGRLRKKGCIWYIILHKKL